MLQKNIHAEKNIYMLTTNIVVMCMCVYLCVCMCAHLFSLWSLYLAEK